MSAATGAAGAVVAGADAVLAGVALPSQASRSSLSPLRSNSIFGRAPSCTTDSPLSSASSALTTSLLRVILCLSSSARAKPASLRFICGRGRASPLRLAESTASDSSTSLRFLSSRALRVPSSAPVRAGLSPSPWPPFRLTLRLLHSPSASRSALRVKLSSRRPGSLRLPLRVRSLSALASVSRAGLSSPCPLRSKASWP
ncbi:hypothetical protein D3C80_1029970 [compost metagenome]